MSESVLWPLERHTGAKHALLKLYLDRWFPILGKYHQRINYIDGFAGPGRYAGGEKGSPLLAIESAMEHVAKGTLPTNVTVNFIFIENKEDHAEHLRNQLRELSPPPQFKIGVVNGEFRDTIGDILDKIESENKSLAPTFAFVDPFGFSGIPMSLMARILKFQRCEIFVNIMVEFINRFLEHPNDCITSHFPETFGTNDVLKIPNSSGNRLDQLLTLYRRQLKAHAQFIGRFDMHGRRDQKSYSMFFGSNAAKGFEKMKEAMWSVDRYTGNKFSDADPNPVYLFEAWGYDALWDDLIRRFAGQAVRMQDIDAFVIENTDYLPTHARKILKEREEGGDVAVTALPGCKRRGKTFPPDKVQITFPI